MLEDPNYRREHLEIEIKVSILGHQTESPLRRVILLIRALKDVFKNQHIAVDELVWDVSVVIIHILGLKGKYKKVLSQLCLTIEDNFSHP